MLLISFCVSSLCLFIERKNLTLKTCAPDFPARSMTKLYAKIKGARAISLFDFPKTWQVCRLHFVFTFYYNFTPINILINLSMRFIRKNVRNFFGNVRFFP